VQNGNIDPILAKAYHSTMILSNGAPIQELI
jgi:hypothetical protein